MVKHFHLSSISPVTCTKRVDHIHPVLHQLHWLPINYRINYKVATLAHSCPWVHFLGQPSTFDLTQPNPAKFKKPRPNPTQPNSNPTRGLTQPMDNSALAYKVRSTGSPAYLIPSVSVYVPTSNLRSLSQYLLNVPAIRMQIARRAFSHAAPSVWNGHFGTEIRRTLYFRLAFID